MFRFTTVSVLLLASFEPQSAQITMRGHGGKPLLLGTVKNLTETNSMRRVNKYDMAEKGAVLQVMQAYHQQPGDYSNSSFFLGPQDGVRYFSVGPKDGRIIIAQALDREEKSQYHLTIGARDDDGSENYVTMSVYLSDVNDNAPSLIPMKPCVVMENVDPDQDVCTVRGYDPDTEINGPPFQIHVLNIPDGFEVEFHPEMDSGNGGLRVKALRRFDREERSRYSVDVNVTDSAQYPMSAIRSVEIIVGDQNDSPMTDGTKTIYVFSYRGRLGRTHIGNVYVTDADDWDVGDKDFVWEAGPAEYFELTSDGSLYIKANTPKSPVDGYIIRVHVHDRVRQEDATGIVKVFVDYVEESAFNNAGSVRLDNITAEEFISVYEGDKSRLADLRATIAYTLDTNPSNVEIFSIMPKADSSNVGYVDIRFSVRHNKGSGRPYEHSVYLNGKLQKSIREIDQAVKPYGKVTQIGINECSSETCWRGCVNEVSATTEGQLVNSNRTAFVGVRVLSASRCIERSESCPNIDVPQSCTIETCLNGGVCHAPGGSGFFCECARDVAWYLRGPRCEGISRTFAGSRAFAWFQPILPCNTMHVSMQFLARSDGVLLYNGPSGGEPYMYLNGDAKDFLYIGISGGRLHVQIDLGGSFGTLESALLEIGHNLADDRWHSIDLIRREDAAEVSLILDKCINAVADPTGKQKINYASCYVSAVLPSSKTFLNVNSPLQLGGIYGAGDSEDFPPRIPTFDSIDGCIRELNVNGLLYDLNAPVYGQDSEPGCSHTLCGDVTLYDACVQGECLGSVAWLKQNTAVPKCFCDLGWTGQNCDKLTEWHRFDSNSVIQYSTDDRSRTDLFNDFYTDIRLLFLPDRKDTGTLVHASDVDQNKYLTAGLQTWIPSLQYRYGRNSEGKLNTTQETITNKSYAMRLHAIPGVVSLGLDDRTTTDYMSTNYESIDKPYESRILFDPRAILLGSSAVNPADGSDFEGCIADVRWNEESLPMVEQESSPYVTIQKSRGVHRSCPSRPSCASSPNLCSRPLVCMDFWKGPVCTCPQGYKTVVDVLRGTASQCAKSVDQQQPKVGITLNAVAAILVSLLALILLVVMLVCIVRRRRAPLFLRQQPLKDDIRENIMNYSEEGGGETDADSYDISRLRKPVIPASDVPRQAAGAPSRGDPSEVLADAIDLADTDVSAAPFDELRVWADDHDPPGLSAASSLSSIASSVDTQQNVFDNLISDMERWGPRFRQLTELYNT